MGRLVAVAPSSLLCLWTPGAGGAGRLGLLGGLLFVPGGGGGALRIGVSCGVLPADVVPWLEDEVLLALCRCVSRALARSCLF